MVKIGMLIADRYEILEKIGTGGMSDVYKAKDHNLNRPVAVKVLKHEFSENANFVSKFRVEAQAAAVLEHPNIVNVYDVGEERGTYYIVMELVDGITLKDYINKKSSLSAKEATTITLQVALGLEAAHHNGIIHRDIKPHNIIISKEGKVKVTDFGIAKAATSNTITSNVMGSVHYTSPEQARGGYSDVKSDIYSLGVTFFEMVTGRVPFNGDTTVAIAIKHIQDKMPSPREFAPELPYSVEQIILKCCEKSPDRRYQSIEELIIDLKQSLADPDADFVVRTTTDNSASTRMITAREREQIKSQTREKTIAEVAAAGAAASAAASTEGTAASTEIENIPQDITDPGDDISVSPEERPEDRLKTVVRKQTASGTSGSGSTGKNGRRQGTVSRRGNTVPQRKPGRERLPEDFDEEDEYDEFANHYYYEEDSDEDERNVRIQRITTILSIVAVVVVGIVIVLIIGSRLGLLPSGTKADASDIASTQAVMPDVLGEQEDIAAAALRDAGLIPEIQYDDTSDIEAGIVISCSEEAGDLLTAGSKVILTVSANSATSNMIPMPNLYGMTEEEARDRIVSLGLEVGTITSISNDGSYTAGTVVSQSYDAETYLQRGTVVDLSIASEVSYYSDNTDYNNNDSTDNTNNYTDTDSAGSDSDTAYDDTDSNNVTESGTEQDNGTDSSDSESVVVYEDEGVE